MRPASRDPPVGVPGSSAGSHSGFLLLHAAVAGSLLPKVGGVEGSPAPGPCSLGGRQHLSPRKPCIKCFCTTTWTFPLNRTANSSPNLPQAQESTLKKKRKEKSIFYYLSEVPAIAHRILSLGFGRGCKYTHLPIASFPAAIGSFPSDLQTALFFASSPVATEKHGLWLNQKRKTGVYEVV